MFTKTREYPPVLVSTLVIVLSAWMVLFNPGLEKPAYADALIPFPITMPNTVAELLSMADGSIGAIGPSATAVGSLGPTAVAIGGFGIGYGIGMAARKGFSLLWHWGSGHTNTYADPVVAAASGYTITQQVQDTNSNDNNVGIYWMFSVGVPANTSGFVQQFCGTSYTYAGANAISPHASAYTSGPYGGGCGTAQDTAIVVSLSSSGYVYSCQTGQAVSDCTHYPQNWAIGWPTNFGGPTVVYTPGNTAITTHPTRYCTDSNGNTTTVLGTVMHYTDGQDVSTLPVINVPDCPTGTYGTKFTAPTTRDSDGATVPSPIPDWTAPANFMPTAGFPQCPLPDSCVMTLIRHNPDNTLTNCTGTILCQGWRDWPQDGPTITIQTVPDGTTATEKAPIDPQGEYVTCQWGPYTLSAYECVDVATEPANPPAPVDGSITNCLSGAISWNPIDWVFVPVKCVLIWAFEPTPTQMTNWTTKTTSIASKPPVNIATSGVDYLIAVKNIWNACLPTCAGDGTTYGFPVPGEPTGTTFDPIGSAGTTMQTDPKGQMIYGIMQVGIIGGFVWWAWRRIASSFGGKEST